MQQPDKPFTTAVEPKPLDTIHCTICGEDKGLEDYYPSGRGASTGQCKKCIADRQQDRSTERGEAGLPSRPKKSRAKPKPLAISPEKLMEALNHTADPRLELAFKVLEMQQRTIELLVAREK